MREVELLNEGGIFDADLGYINVLEGNGDEISIIKNYPTKILYSVKEEDTLAKLNSKGYICEQGQIKTGDVVLLKKSFNKYHVVKPCETLSMIANRYSKTENELIKTNNLKTNKLFIGQTLNI